MIFAGKRKNLGIRRGKLAPYPGAPNCVSSQSQVAKHKIEPLAYTSTATAAIANLEQVIHKFKRS